MISHPSHPSVVQLLYLSTCYLSHIASITTQAWDISDLVFGVGLLGIAIIDIKTPEIYRTRHGTDE